MSTVVDNPYENHPVQCNPTKFTFHAIYLKATASQRTELIVFSVDLLFSGTLSQ